MRWRRSSPRPLAKPFLDDSLVLERERGELVEAAAPALPLVRGVGRDVEVGVDPGLLERAGVHPGITAEARAPRAIAVLELAAAEADEQELDLLLESGRAGDILRADAATAEDAHLRERLRAGQGDDL